MTCFRKEKRRANLKFRNCGDLRERNIERVLLARWSKHVTIEYDVSKKIIAGGHSRIQKGGFRSEAGW